MPPRKIRTKNSRTVTISYGHLEDMIETFLRTTKTLSDDEDLTDIKWPLGNEHLNLCRRDTKLNLEITTRDTQ